MTPAAGPLSVSVLGVTNVQLMAVDADGRAVGAPQALDPAGIDPSSASSSTMRLVVLAIGVLGPVRIMTVDRAGDRFEFVVGAVSPDTVALLVEIYRRPDGTWKLRALGESLPDVVALQQLFRLQSLPWVAADGPQPAPPDAVAEPPRDWSRIAAGIWEDASRSAATFADAERHAALNRDRELERLVAEVAGRSPDDPRRTRIESQHDDIVQRAGTRRFAELDELIAELRELEQSVPAGLARWDSAAWWPLAEQETPIVRTGELTRSDSTALRIPMFRSRTAPGGYLVTPWNADDDRVVRSLVRRLLAAGPPGRGLWVLSDDVAVHRQWAMAGSEHAGRGIDASLAELAHRVDLADMAAEAGESPPVEAALPSVVLLVLDRSWAPVDEPGAVGQLRRVAILGPRYGVSVLFLGQDDLRNSFGEGVPGSLLPIVPAQIEDPWVGLTWNFVPDDGTPADEVAFAIDLRARRSG